MTKDNGCDAPTPIVEFIRIDDQGEPYLAGSRCKSCGHIYFGERDVCAKCFARGQMESVRLAETGKVYVWSIVHRSFPGVETPFIDVIVDLDDGSTIKGILRQVDPLPEEIQCNMPVRVKFEEAVPPGQNRSYLAYHFVPNN